MHSNSHHGNRCRFHDPAETLSASIDLVFDAALDELEREFQELQFQIAEGR